MKYAALAPAYYYHVDPENGCKCGKCKPEESRTVFTQYPPARSYSEGLVEPKYYYAALVAHQPPECRVALDLEPAFLDGEETV